MHLVISKRRVREKRQGGINNRHNGTGAYLGYKPKVSFEEGTKELVEWASKIEARDRFDEAYKELEEKRLVGK